MVNLFQNLFTGFIAIAYPEYCSACNRTLFAKEKWVCGICQNSLPKTNFHNYRGNPAEKLFWGKAKIRSAMAYYFFRKGGGVQEMMHQFKYKGKKEIGEVVGRWYAEELAPYAQLADVDIILSVPLHPDKLLKRGYNQAEHFALGMASVFQKPVDTQSLTRTKFTNTQTRKRIFDRHTNVDDVFSYKPINNNARHILLVDDVLTTGSTLTSCINAIHLASDTEVEISVAAMAIAHK
jgi:ComF family protein